MEQITLDSGLIWDVVAEENGELVLFCASDIGKRPFSTFSDSRYLRIDYSGASDGALLETEAQGSSRYNDLSAYGCNQWPVSDLRSFLNGPFLSSLPSSFVSRLVPVPHRLPISESPTIKKNHQKGGSIFTASDGSALYDDFSIPGKRVTFCTVTDFVFVPSRADLERYSSYFDKISSEKDLSYGWLMDAAVQNVYYAYFMFRTRSGLSYNFGNAGNVFPVYPMCRIKK